MVNIRTITCVAKFYHADLSKLSYPHLYVGIIDVSPLFTKCSRVCIAVFTIVHEYIRFDVEGVGLRCKWVNTHSSLSYVTPTFFVTYYIQIYVHLNIIIFVWHTLHIVTHTFYNTAPRLFTLRALTRLSRFLITVGNQFINCVYIAF